VTILQASIDFNQYLGIQRMGVACLQLPQQRVRDYAAVWQQRASALVQHLRQHGWQLPEPQACEWPGCCLFVCSLDCLLGTGQRPLLKQSQCM
jgi:hypothetical protein